MFVYILTNSIYVYFYMSALLYDTLQYQVVDDKDLLQVSPIFSLTWPAMSRLICLD